MPVTAKLSLKFYERFGEEVTTELVEWFNQVDATYRSDLRELNESNFARFDAKLEQRLAEMEARFDGKLAELRVEMDRRFADLRVEMDRRFADLRVEIASAKTDMMRWMFALWFTQLAAFLALWLRGP